MLSCTHCTMSNSLMKWSINATVYKCGACGNVTYVKDQLNIHSWYQVELKDGSTAALFLEDDYDWVTMGEFFGVPQPERDIFEKDFVRIIGITYPLP